MTGKAARQTTMLTAVMPDALVPQRHPIGRIKPMVDRVVAQLQERFPQAAQMLADALPDILASPPSQFHTGRNCGLTTRWKG